MSGALNQGVSGIPTIPAICPLAFGAIQSDTLRRILRTNHNYRTMLEHCQEQVEMLNHLERIRIIEYQRSILILVNQARLLNNLTPRT